MEEVRIKGGSVLHLKQFLVEDQGEPEVSGWIDALDDELRDIMRLPLPAAWYPFSHYLRLERAAVDRFYGGNPIAAERIGAYDLRQNISRFFRIMLRAMNVTFLLDKTSQMWGHVMSAGEAVVIRDEDGKGAALEIRGLQPTDEVWFYDMVGSVREALRMCGAKNPHVRIHRGNGRDGLAARIHGRWD
jgi:hypothetical protein